MQLVPHVSTEDGWAEASRILDSRLIGDETRQAVMHQSGKNPWHNTDGKLQERSAVWSVMQLNDDVLYDVDRQVFVTKDASGKTADKFTLAQVLAVRNSTHAEEQHLATARWLRDQQGLDIPGVSNVAHWDDNRGAPFWNPQNLIRDGYFTWRPGKF